MTPELEKYYETYFDLFTTDGWKQFIEDVNENAKTFDVRNVPDEQALNFVKGQLLIIDKLLNWEASVEVAYNQVKEEDEE
jgi:hypothetical protein